MAALPRYLSKIDPHLVPASLWTRDHLRRCDALAGSTALTIALKRDDGTASLFRTKLLPAGTDDAANYLHAERTVKFLLWSRGAPEVLMCGPLATSLAESLQVAYSPAGSRAFDADFFFRIFQKPFASVPSSHPPSRLLPPPTSPLGAILMGVASALTWEGPIANALP